MTRPEERSDEWKSLPLRQWCTIILMDQKHQRAILLLRLGLAFVFLYASVGSLLYPDSWIWFIPGWIQKIIPPTPLLLAHAGFELMLGLILLSGKKTFFVAIVAALDLLAIMLPNINIFDTVFRDVGLLFMALALINLTKPSAEKN